MKVRFCENNKGKSKVYRRLLEEYPEVDAKIKKCLGMCGTCSEQPVAMVDGQKVKGKDVDELYRLIAATLSHSGGKDGRANAAKKEQKGKKVKKGK